MKRKTIIIAAALAASAGAAALAFEASSVAEPYSGGWGYMGPSMMGSYGPGWMHGGYGPGSMHGSAGYGPGWCWGNDRDSNDSTATPSGQPETTLSTDDVRARMESWLAREGNPRLKLGDVKEKDADTITAEIVTIDNSLVQRLEIDRNTGFTHPEGG